MFLVSKYWMMIIIIIAPIKFTIKEAILTDQPVNFSKPAHP
jgi:hypothetical protein